MQKVENGTGNICKNGDRDRDSDPLGEHINDDQVRNNYYDSKGDGLGNRALFGLLESHAAPIAVSVGTEGLFLASLAGDVVGISVDTQTSQAWHS